MLSFIFMMIMVLTISHSKTITTINCDLNENYVGCGRPISCQPSCNEPQERKCPRMCSLALPCACKKGFVRDSNLKCINQSQCRTQTIDNVPICGTNEVAVNCAPMLSCQPSCDKPSGTACPRLCSSTNSCVCKKDYIRASSNNQTCIQKTQCKKHFVICGDNEEYTSCVNPCQPSCEQPDQQPCPTFQCLKGCVCSKGYLRATNSTTSPCVKCGK